MQEKKTTIKFNKLLWEVDVQKELSPCPIQMQLDIKAFESEKKFRNSLKPSEINYQTFQSKINIK
jgi:hypothetical protein